MSFLSFLEGKPFNALSLTLTVVAIIVGTIYSRKGLRANRRRLTVAALPPAPLLAHHPQGLPHLEVAWNGTILPDPHIVTFILDNYGRAAIDSSCFDSGRPVRLNLGVTVVEVLKVALRPNSASTFVHAREANAVTLGPDVLKPSQRLTIQILVAGEPDLDAVLEEHLTNTEVEYVPPGASPKFRPRSKFEMIATWVPVVFVSAMLLVTLVAVLLAVLRPNAVLNFSPRSAGAGQSVEVSGSTFRPNSNLQLFVRCGSASSGLLLGGVEEHYPLAETRTNAEGSFRVRVQIPRVPDLKECALVGTQDSTSWKPGITAERDFI